MTSLSLGWIGIIRLGLVQTALGAVVILTTSTINRLMIVELALPAILPGLLITLHYALQILRPRWGYGSDISPRRTPWIIGGMGVLALGGCGAAISVLVLSWSTLAGILVATFSFTLIGIGVGAAGTSLLALLSASVEERRRPAAATIVWVMMIAGFIITASVVGRFIDPFSHERLIVLAVILCGTAFTLTVAAVWGVEKPQAERAIRPEESAPFKQTYAQLWADPSARRFAIFVFVSMLAYSAQDLILEPFAGIVFGYTPGQSTALSGVQNAGVLVGMILVGVAATVWHKGRAASLRNWTAGGCLGSALALICLIGAAITGPGWPLKPSVFMLGFANGVFAVAAIGSMFSMAAGGPKQRPGVRMGLFGAAQAIAFGLGGFFGTALVDATKIFTSATALPYGLVFAIEACLFIAAAILAMRIGPFTADRKASNPLILAGQHHAGVGGN
jgi:BCD family chlorophyll transporter-like MFS transporter